MPSILQAQEQMHELIPLKGPTVVHAHNIMDQQACRTFRGPEGATLRQLAPKTSQATLCIYNGEFVLPEDLDWVPSYEDHVRFVILPKGGGGASQAILGVVLIVVGVIVPGAQALIYIGAGLLVSGLLPAPNFTPLTESQVASPSPTYNVQLSGNSARLGQSVPVPYGRHLMVPDFASQSYSEFDNDDNQFYHALFCLGQVDKFTLESVMIDDTELSHFEDVETQLVGPNYPTALSLVNPAVVNAPEVAGQDMNQFEYVGPFASCGPGLRATHIGIDITCPKGLYKAKDNGDLEEKTTTWLVEARPINDRGGTAGDWFLLGSETLTAATNKKIRRSYKYGVSAGRYEVRVSRTDTRDDNIRAGHDLQWLGMRSYIDAPAPLEPSATFLAFRIRANSQLSGLSQRRITVIIRRWLPTWNPTTGWSAPVETRSIAWAFADVLRNTDYGAKVADSRIDLQTLYELDQVWADRGDTFNAIFDKRVTVWSALTTIARAGRARPIMRGSVFTLVRDEQQDLPVALFSMRNIERGSFSIDYNMLSDDATDGLELEFYNEESWASDYITIKVNSNNTFSVVGVGEEGPANPAKMSIMGVTSYDQAEREALYIVADSVYRRSAIAFTTEMEGYLPAYGDLIAVSHDIAGWGVSGDVEDWDDSGLVMTVTEDLNWTVGDNYCILVNSQGDVFGPYKVTPGEAERTMVFQEAPDVDAEIYTGTERERTRFAMGPANSYARFCRVVSLTPKTGDTIEIRAVVEDNRVHAAYGGSSGGTPGNGDRVARYAPDDCPAYDAASDAQQQGFGFYSTDNRTVGANNDEGYVYAD